MGAADPTYPLFPIASFLAAALLLLILLSRFVRQNWNLGVCFLSFWLFVVNVISGMNAIIWSDSNEIKLYIYCDIVSHLQLMSFTVQSSATLIIIRRLYTIASVQSVEPPSGTAKQWDVSIEWILGFLFPILVAGPLYYVVQAARFGVVSVQGCVYIIDDSGLSYLLLYTWPILFPLISILVYYPKVAYTFYRHNRDVNRYLRTNNTITHSTYFRVLTLASIDILVTLPLGVTVFAFAMVSDRPTWKPLYPGWDYVHVHWAPYSFPDDAKAARPVALASKFFFLWKPPALAFVIFSLFGLTGEAIESYCQALRYIGLCLCFKQKVTSRKQGDLDPSALAAIELERHPQETAQTATIVRAGSITASSEAEQWGNKRVHSV
ncbi:unnamed protein product [Peniophora sp. CBMAI 1063]|nr:unnamed protein product [Peniophora sp. CBMAI 1063]